MTVTDIAIEINVITQARKLTFESLKEKNSDFTFICIKSELLFENDRDVGYGEIYQYVVSIIYNETGLEYAHYWYKYNRTNFRCCEGFTKIEE
jgi:hypothetical protein